MKGYRRKETTMAAGRVLKLAAALLLIWWVLVGNNPGLWFAGVPLLVLSLLLAVRSAPVAYQPWQPHCLPGFMLYFLRQSWRGGIDVAIRALHPKRPLAPQLIHYHLRLPEGAPQVVFANSVSLLPGSLSVELMPSCLLVHVLAYQPSIDSDLLQLENQVARLFALPPFSGKDGRHG